MASSIEQAKELKALLEEQNKLMSQQTEMLKTQMGIMRQMADAVRQMNIEGLGRGTEEMSGAVKNAGDAVEKLGNSQQNLGDLKKILEDGRDNMDNLGKSAENFGKKMMKLAPVVATIEGMVGGFKLSMNAMSSLISVGGGLISTLTNVGASIIALPFKMLYGLMNQVGGGGGQLRQEFENVRKTFGDLASNEGKAVIDSWRKVDHFGGQLAETGLSVWRTMGNMAETMARLREIAEQMGPLFHNFQRQLAEGGERIFAYQKGMHLTEEGLRAVTETAQRSGETFQEVGRHITSTAFAMGEAFGMNGALISQDIGTMMDDFEHFGSLGVQELSQVSVYARKLGVEIQKLTGALDQFADFDKAAESVAQLSQAFGLQLDTLEMVNEQDPAANIERLRKAFFAAGRSIETMTRQERALLAAQTGLDEKTASLVFSQENQALSYADIQKQGENAEKQQLSQAEAMQKLAGSIERLVKSGSALQGGFIDIFLQGFMRGIRFTKEFYGLMWNLRRAMRETFIAGRQVGQLFVKNFPGVRDVLKGIAELFDPRRFRKMLNGVVGAFREFFQDMTKNPAVALPKLLDRLKKSFTNWFDSSTPAGRRIIDGFKRFFKASGQIFGSLLKIAIQGATQAIRGLIDFIKDPSAAISAATSAGSGFASFMAEVLQPAWDALVKQGPALLEALIDLLTLVSEKLKPMIIKAAPGFALAMFGPAFVGGMTRGLISALGVVFTRGIVQFIGSGALKQGASLLSRGMSGMMQSTAAVNKAASAASGAGDIKNVGAAAKATADMNKGIRGFGPREAAKLGLSLVAIATALSIGGVMLAGALALMNVELRLGGIKNIIGAVLPLAVLGAAIGAMIITSNMAKALSPAASGQMALNLGLAALALSVGGIAFAGSLAAINAILDATGLNDIRKIALPFLVLGAAVLATLALVAVGASLEPTTVSIVGAMLLVAAIMLSVSGVAFAGALWLISKTLNSAGIDTVEKAAFPLMVIAGAAGAFAVMALAVMAMAAIANPALLIAGLVGMAAVAGVAYLAIEGLGYLKSATDKYSDVDFAKVLSVLGGAAMVYGAIGAMALAASLLGLVMVSGGGIIGLVAGLATIAVVTDGIKEHLPGIVSAIKAIPPIEQSKVDTFVEIIKAVGSFAGDMASVMNAASPSFLSLAAMPWGRNPQEETKQNMGLIEDLITAIGGQVKGIIQSLVSNIKGLNENELNQAEKLGAIISAVANLANAMKPDTELTEGFFGDLLSVRVIQAAGMYFEQLADNLPGLIESVIQLLPTISNMPNIDEGKISAFSSFVGGIGTLLSALSPSGGMMAVLGLAQGISEVESMATGALSTLSEAFGGPSISRETNHAGTMMNMISQFAEVMLGILTKGGFLKTIQGFIGSMSQIASGLSESQIKGLEVVSGIFESLVGLVSSLAEKFSSEEFLKALTSTIPDPTQVRTVFAGIVGGIIGPAAYYIPRIVEQLTEATRGLSKGQITNLASVVDIFGSVIGSVGSLSEVVSNLGSSETVGFKEQISRMSQVLTTLVGSEDSGFIRAIQTLAGVRLSRGASRTLKTIGEAIEAIGNIMSFMPQLGAIAMNPRMVQAMAAGINHLVYYGHGPAFLLSLQRLGEADISSSAVGKAKLIGRILEPIGDIATNIQAAAQGLDSALIGQMSDGVLALTNRIEGISNALKNVKGFNIDTSLHELNNKLGLRSTGRLDIREEPITFNVNFTVHIDAEELETVLVERPNSRIATTGT